VLWCYVDDMRVTLRSAAVVLGLSVLGVFAGGQALAGARDGDAYVTPPPAEVQAATVELSPSQPATVAEARAVQSSALAFTGTDAMALTLAGAATIACGAALLAFRRRAEAS
jgi:LPXTG-motif cell wall-anchored protein